MVSPNSPSSETIKKRSKMNSGFGNKTIKFRPYGHPIAEWMTLPYVTVRLSKMYNVDTVHGHEECHPVPRWKEERILPKLLHTITLFCLEQGIDRHEEFVSYCEGLANMSQALAFAHRGRR
jgi:hypothetical protein